MLRPAPFLPGFSSFRFARVPRLSLDKLPSFSGFAKVYTLFERLVSPHCFQRETTGLNSRDRTLPPSITFWAFIAQVLTPGASCREMVRQLEAQWRAANPASLAEVSDSAYCQARARLKGDTLQQVAQGVIDHLEQRVAPRTDYFAGRAIKLVDGTNLSMPDEPALQALWPQSNNCQPGCGFPLLKLVGLFSFSSGALLAQAHGNQHTSEGSLLKDLRADLLPEDILVGDRAFCSYASLGELKALGIDTVSRLGQKCGTMRPGKILGPGDQLFRLVKPGKRSALCTLEQWQALPDELEVRIIEVTVSAPGFRTEHLRLITTLCDAQAYPADQISDLYGKRWNVEGHFNQLKTLLGLNVLRCKSPLMVLKELQIHLIAYNLIRSLMQVCSQTQGVALNRISFKGTLDTLRHWAPLIDQAASSPRQKAKLLDEMHKKISQDLIPIREGRSEPRARKRKPKQYPKLHGRRSDPKIGPQPKKTPLPTLT